MGRKGVKMKLLAVFGLVCILAVGAIAQQRTVTGTVTSKGGKPLVNTTVKLQKNNTVIAESMTGTDGRFSFSNVADGVYYVVYSDENNRVVVDEVRVTNGNAVTAVSGGPIREKVTVSAGEGQSIEQVSKTVDVISGQEMRDRADFSLAETLRTIPGFRVQQLGGFGRTATIKTRGLRNQDTAILMDGIRFRDASAITGDASPFLSDFTLTSVSKIEVLRGSGSSLHGTNAIGGTVDFQTPRPASGTHGQISGAFGGLGLGRFRGNISHGLANGKFGIGGGVSRTVYTKGIDGQDDAYNTNVQTRVEFNPFSKTSISGRIFASDADVRLNSGPDTLGPVPLSNSIIIRANPNVNFAPDENDPDSFQRSRFFSGQLVVNQVINSKLLLSGYYQGLTTKRTNDNGPLGAGYQSASTSIFDGTINTANVHLNWTPAETNEVTAGYEFEAEKFGNDGRTPTGTSSRAPGSGAARSTCRTWCGCWVAICSLRAVFAPRFSGSEIRHSA
jgi:vitamin B12 transporter